MPNISLTSPKNEKRPFSVVLKSKNRASDEGRIGPFKVL